MNKVLLSKVRETLRQVKDISRRLDGRIPFIAFSTGKDSLAMAAMLYEALPDRLPCLYSHHKFEFSVNLGYANEMRDRGFDVRIVHPFLGYFELMKRGIGFLTL